MYETYFNFAERPFASVPRIDHYYPASVIDAARITLVRCVDRGEGVAMIIGPSGTGKSPVLSRRAIPEDVPVPSLASTHSDILRARSCRRSSTSELSLSRHGRVASCGYRLWITSLSAMTVNKVS